MTEEEKMDEFHKWLVSKNPRIGTCVELMKSIDKFVQYKLETLKILEDSKNAMDAHFADLIVKNFPEAGI